MEHDVAIVGAGPAGARAAWQLARGGARVALIDASHPREKPCGGGVTGRALRLVADQLDRAGGPRPDGVAVNRAVFMQNGARAVVDLHVASRVDGSALVIFPRAAFDLQLLEGARAVGATYLKTRARDVALTARGSEIHLESGDTLKARWVVGADGANSLVRRRLLSPFSRSELSIATGYFVRGASSREIVVEFVPDPPGYLWSFPRADHLAVGVCAQADRTSSEHLRGIAHAWIAHEGIRGTLEPYSWPIPSLPPAAFRQQQPAGPGWLLVGDAAGLVDPVTREGIFFAVQSADIAAASILRRRDPAAAYREGLQDEIVPELARAGALKAGFFRPAFTGLLINALQTSSRVRAVMADLVAGEQPYRTLVRRLLRTMEVGLAWELLKIRRPHYLMR